MVQAFSALPSAWAFVAITWGRFQFLDCVHADLVWRGSLSATSLAQLANAGSFFWCFAVMTV